jgi:hypothetical protein
MAWSTGTFIIACDKVGASSLEQSLGSSSSVLRLDSITLYTQRNEIDGRGGDFPLNIFSSYVSLKPVSMSIYIPGYSPEKLPPTLEERRTKRVNPSIKHSPIATIYVLLQSIHKRLATTVLHY